MKQSYLDQTFSKKLSLFTPTYFAVAASNSELKPTRTFTIMHEKLSFGIKANKK